MSQDSTGTLLSMEDRIVQVSKDINAAISFLEKGMTVKAYERLKKSADGPMDSIIYEYFKNI